MITIGHRTFIELHGRTKRVHSKSDGHYGDRYDDTAHERMLISDRLLHASTQLLRPFEEIEELTYRAKPKRRCTTNPNYAHRYSTTPTHLQTCNQCWGRYRGEYDLEQWLSHTRAAQAFWNRPTSPSYAA